MGAASDTLAKDGELKMKPYFEENMATVYNASSLNTGLPDESVQCVTTSPPYWGLRKYDGEQDAGGFVFGLEEIPELYVQHTILFLREIWRVLRKDGVCFWNVGDSYSQGSNNNSSFRHDKAPVGAGHVLPHGHKPKDLCLIPQRVAIAAQEDGWWVRSDIIWAKPNPMPESVRDRPTNAYEHILMLTKSKKYYWDIDAVREPHTTPDGMGWAANGQGSQYHTSDYGNRRGKADFTRSDGLQSMGGHPNGRNLRDVWTIATQPSGFKHYAAFPAKLPELCIKAATKPGDTVLDPFAGTGRALEVALKLGREAIGFDVSEKYCDMIVDRCKQGVLGK